MQKIKENQSGFIPMLIALLVIIGVIVYLAYVRVLHAQK